MNANLTNTNLDISDLLSFGFCNTCDTEESFFNLPDSFWELRENFYCHNCESRPRERALFYILSTYFPNWWKMKIHEFAPVFRGFSKKILNHNKTYTFSGHLPSSKTEEKKVVPQNGNLENLDFDDDEFDLFITQDVVNFSKNPERTFKEIARVLKKGGAHIFTVPLVQGHKPSEPRMKITKGKIDYIKEEVNYNNQLLTYDWGYDIGLHIFNASKMVSTIHHIENNKLSIRGMYSEIIVSRKM